MIGKAYHRRSDGLQFVIRQQEAGSQVLTLVPGAPAPVFSFSTPSRRLCRARSAGSRPRRAVRRWGRC